MKKTSESTIGGDILRMPKSFTEHPRCLMSNFDRDIDESVAKYIKNKPLYAQYSGWNFCGWVWWQNKKWCCEIWVYGGWCETFVANTLSEIMENVSQEYGYD